MTIVGTIPYLFAGGVAAAAAGAYSHGDVAYDYAVNGIPFLSGIRQDPNSPLLRKTAPYKKQRFDNANDPGDQSLDFWWLKGQSTFHGGAGQLYIDTPVSQGAEIRPIRFQESAGVDVWSQGKFSLLKTTSRGAAVSATTKCPMVTITIGGTDYIVYADGTALKMLTRTGADTFTTTTLTSGLTSTIQSVVTDGTNWYATDGTAVTRGTPTATGVATSMYALTSGTAVLGWHKLRLMLGYTTSSTSKVYVLDPAASAAPLPTATFTHPNTAFLWTCFADGPGAIYAGGYAGINSTIYKFVLDTSSTTPTITSGIEMAPLPPTEIVLAMRSYLATSMGIVTSAGVRVAQFQASQQVGDFAYGPLSVTFSSAATYGAIIGKDRFFYASYTDTSGVGGLVRIDLSQQLNVRPFSYQPDQRFAWAPDLRATDTSDVFYNGSTSAVDITASGRMCFVVPGQGVFIEHSVNYTPSGHLTTSRIRYDTLDPKLAKYIRARAEGTGTLSVAVNKDADSGGANAITIDVATAQDTTDVALFLERLTYATVTLTLTRSTVTATPSCYGYQLKALPAQRRLRYIQVPLLCFDDERDYTGGSVGYDGSALERLRLLEELDALGDVVNFQVLNPDPDNEYSALCVIEDLTFTQTTVPTDKQGWGGIIQLTLRTVA